MVKLELAVPEAGSDVWDGLKLHVIPNGRPTQAKVTCPENVDNEVTVTETAEDGVPYRTATFPVERLNSMSGATGATMRVAF
jgi:hypothetical protein